MYSTVKLPTARELVAAGGVRQVTLLGQPGGFAVLLNLGMSEKALATKDGTPRMFPRLEAAARVVDELGVREFVVDARKFSAPPPRRRADVAQRMAERAARLQAVEAFEAEVAIGFADADAAGEDGWVPLHAVVDELRAQARSDAKRGG